MDYLLFTETDILERVDEYTLYCHYLRPHLGEDVVIGATYPSPAPLRHSNKMTVDERPSFGIFERKTGGILPHEFLWKDQAGGFVGDVFDLVGRLNGLSSKWEAIQRIASEFGFGAPWKGAPVIDVRIERKVRSSIDIAVKSAPWSTRTLLYWDRYHISRKIVDWYHVKPVGGYWLTKDQLRPYIPKRMMFSYKILNKYQLYSPYAETNEDKFLNDWTDLCVPGFEQLQKNQDTCIITKAMKDVMCLRSFGYEAVSPRGERIMLPPECIAYLKRHYKRIIVLFDNDGKHNGDKYEFPKVFIPKLLDTDKDPTDFCDNHGPDETRKMLKSLIYAI